MAFKRYFIFTFSLITLTACLTTSSPSLPPIDYAEQAEKDNDFLLEQIDALNDSELFEAQRLFLKIDNRFLSPKSLAKYRILQQELMIIPIEAKTLGVSYDSLSALKVDHDDFWIGDWLGSFVRYNFFTHTSLVLRLGEVNQLDANVLNHIYFHKNMVYGVASDGILTYKKSNGEVSFYTKPKQFSGYFQAAAFYKGELLLATQGMGLWQLKGDTLSQSSLNKAFLKTAYTLEVWHNKLWVATDNGVWVYDDKQDEWTAIEALKNVAVYCFIIDDDRLWMGTMGQGLFLYNDENVSLETEPDLWVKTGLIYNDRLYLGTLSKGLLKMDPETMELSEVTLTPEITNIECLAMFDAGYLLVGTLNHSLYMVHKSLL